MAKDFIFLRLTGSNGSPQIQVTASGSFGDVVHTAPTGTEYLDQVWLYASVTGSVSQSFVLEVSGTSYSPVEFLRGGIGAQSGDEAVLVGQLVLTDGERLAAYVTSTSPESVLLKGYVQRVSQSGT